MPSIIDMTVNLKLSYDHSNGTSGGSAAIYVPDAGNNKLKVIALQSSVQPPLLYAVVLDRSNPTGKPLFEQNLANNTDLPPALGNLLTNDHLFFFFGFTGSSSVPQGPLYQALAKHGGGAELEQIEVLCTGFACGVYGSPYYMLASAPGTGITGFETNGVFKGYNLTAADFSTNTTMLLRLEPDATGGYMPTMVGTPVVC